MIAPRLVMMDGVAPGIGKSTLAASLADVLQDCGAAVDLFPEEDLFTRPEFAHAAQGFRDKNFPTPEVFLPAYAATFERMRAQHAWGIFDWNCAGMASDLPWATAEPPRLQRLVHDVRNLAAEMSPVVLFLHGDVREATRRAAAERGQTWIDRYARIAADHCGPAGPDLERIVSYQERTQRLRQADLEILRTTGWIVLSVDAMADRSEVLEQTMSGLGLAPST